MSKKSSKAQKTKSPLVRRVRVDEIVVRGDFRKLNKKAVSSLAESIKEVGLIHPPTVFIKPAKGKSRPEEVRLVAGQHRLAAIKTLGRRYINVTVVKRAKEKNLKRRITENLHRSELKPAEKGRLIKKWLALCSKEGGQVGQPHDKGVSDAAEKFGVSRNDIRRKLKAADLSANAEKALKEAGLDHKQTIVLEVAEEEPEDQVAKVKEIVHEREKKERRKGKVREKNAEERQSDRVSSQTPFGKLERAWKNSPAFRAAWADAGPQDRKRFINELLLYDATVANANDNDNDDAWNDVA